MTRGYSGREDVAAQITTPPMKTRTKLQYWILQGGVGILNSEVIDYRGEVVLQFSSEDENFTMLLRWRKHVRVSTHNRGPVCGESKARGIVMAHGGQMYEWGSRNGLPRCK